MTSSKNALLFISLFNKLEKKEQRKVRSVLKARLGLKVSKSFRDYKLMTKNIFNIIPTMNKLEEKEMIEILRQTKN